MEIRGLVIVDVSVLEYITPSARKPRIDAQSTPKVDISYL